MKFVSMATIVKFDDMYASAIYEEKMKQCVGKVLPVRYRRHMGKLFELRESRRAMRRSLRQVQTAI